MKYELAHILGNYEARGEASAVHNGVCEEVWSFAGPGLCTRTMLYIYTIVFI